jgi:hypothetical protein
MFEMNRGLPHPPAAPALSSMADAFAHASGMAQSHANVSRRRPSTAEGALTQTNRS